MPSAEIGRGAAVWRLGGAEDAVRLRDRLASEGAEGWSELAAWSVVEGDEGCLVTVTWELAHSSCGAAVDALAARAGAAPRAGAEILRLGTAETDGATGLLLFAMEPPPELEDEFNAWYDTEHCPRLAAVSGALSARRYRVHGDVHPRYLALYHLRDPDVCGGPEWTAAADTPWSARMRALTRRRQRLVCRRIEAPAAPRAGRTTEEEAHA